jgi:hypothetical protein
MVIAILRSCHPDKNCHDDYTVIENVDSDILRDKDGLALRGERLLKKSDKRNRTVK